MGQLGDPGGRCRVVFGDETNEVNSLPASVWDSLFPLDAQWPATTPVTAVLAQPISTVTQPISTVDDDDRSNC